MPTPIAPTRLGWPGGYGDGDPGGAAGPGAATRKAVTIASVAGAAATAWATDVVTANDTRYLSGPEVAMTLRREVFSVSSFNR
jgi:hypothetical protein